VPIPTRRRRSSEHSSRTPDELLGRVVALLVVAGGFAAAAWFLWQTKVPGGLDLDGLDVHRYFTVQTLDKTADYARFGRIFFILSELTLLLVLAGYARWGSVLTRESAAGPIGTGMLLAMLGLGILWLAQLPFTILDLWWERRHGLLLVGYLEAIVGGWLALGSTFLSICLAILIVMGLARLVGGRWWIPGAAVFVGIGLLFTFLTPYLLDTHRLRDPALRAAAARIERAEGVAPTPIEVEDMRRVTTAPNAEAAGLGPSRRIILWDTLIDGRFSRPEIGFVIAHEVGHLARAHLWKGIAWYALFAFPGAYLIARFTRRRGGMARAEAVPLSLFVLVVLALLALPFQNAISRHMEAEADWMALETTRDPEAGLFLFQRFTQTALEQPSPPTWSYLLLDGHPTVAQRIAMVNAWRARAQATSADQSP
jgi:STE24 endopeptidase